MPRKYSHLGVKAEGTGAEVATQSVEPKVAQAADVTGTLTRDKERLSTARQHRTHLLMDMSHKQDHPWGDILARNAAWCMQANTGSETQSGAAATNRIRPCTARSRAICQIACPLVFENQKAQETASADRNRLVCRTA